MLANPVARSGTSGTTRALRALESGSGVSLLRSVMSLRVSSFCRTALPTLTLLFSTVSAAAAHSSPSYTGVTAIEIPNMASEKKPAKAPSKREKSAEEILTEFQSLRNEQRILANKLSEMEMELNEHKIVIDTLKNVDPKRKCYRMIGGLLCERTVEDVMPALVTNKEQLMKVMDTLNDQVTKKGIEMNEYKEKHNIRIRGQDDLQQQEEDNDNKEDKRKAIVVNPIEI